MTDSIPAEHVQRLLLLHLSDTHNMHEQIEKVYPFPHADILLHTGDLTNHGTLEELRSVNEWFGTIKHRFKHILVIAGNHDVHGNNGDIDLKDVLTNVSVLHHEVADTVSSEFGLRVYGSPWCAWKPANNPGGDGHWFDRIPSGIDVLMTHGPARGVFDTAQYHQAGHSVQCFPWGSSHDLNNAVMRAKPRVHLFGHLHEQRGVWQRDVTGEYVGGVEYEAAPGQRFPTTGAPPKDWPCDLVSCNAMCNHERHEENATGIAARKHIAGGARQIVASRRSEEEPWQFSAV